MPLHQRMLALLLCLAALVGLSAEGLSCAVLPSALAMDLPTDVPTAAPQPLAEPDTPDPDLDPSEDVSTEELAETDAEMNALSADESLTLRQKLDKVFTSYTTMGACVVVFQNGKITFTHTYGLRQRVSAKAAKALKTPPLPVTEDTLFQVGSIGKMVAGIGLLRLVEEGKAELDSDLGDLLGFPLRNPQYPNTPITLRQLMTHTAGLRDSRRYTQAIRGKPQPLASFFTEEMARATFYRDQESGTVSEYSNFGGGMAGSLIEALSGETIDEYLTQELFAPLQIQAGYQASLLPDTLKLADMYAMPSRRLQKALREDPTHILTPDPQHDYFLTAGKLIISAPDLAKILIMLCDGGIYEDTRILKESMAQELLTPQNFRGSVTCESKRGLFVNIITDAQVEGRTLYGHGGKANGMLCAAYFDPTDRTGVVMLTNGCNNRKVYQGVGMLGRAVFRVCYTELLDALHVPKDPFLVVD